MAAQAAKCTTLQPRSVAHVQTGHRHDAQSRYAAQRLPQGAALLMHSGQQAEQQPAQSLHHQPACAVNARFSQRIQQPNSRFALQPATPDALPASAPYLRLPAHRALAARLSAAATRAAAGSHTTSQQQQQQRERRRLPRNGNVWSVDLQADVAAVCKEVGLSKEVAAALATAAAAGQVSANPGVLLSQLLRLLPLEGELGIPGSVAQLLTAQPALLHSDPATLRANLAGAQQLLGEQRAASIAMRYPQLLTCSAFRLHSNVAALQELLQFSSAAAAAGAAAEQPLLLLSSPQSLRLRWQQLQQLMSCVPGATLAKQLRRNPGLLLLWPSTIAAKMQCLQAVLGQASDDDGDDVAGSAFDTAEEPSPAASVAGSDNEYAAATDTTATAAAADRRERLRLQHQQQQVASALARLKAAAARRHAWLQQQQQQVRHHLRPSSWTQQRQDMQSTWQLPAPVSTAPTSSSNSSSGARVQQLVLKVPGLLCLNPSTMQQHVTELLLLLGLQPGDAALRRMLLLQPGLLTQAPRTLANKLQLLQYLTSRDEAAVQEMVLKCPAVLTLSVASISSKWEMLDSCCAAADAAGGSWQQQLQQAAPVTLAMVLCYSPQRLLRLQYVLQLHSSSTVQQAAHTRDANNACASSSSGGSSSSAGGSSKRRRSKAAGSSSGAAAQQQGLAGVAWRVLVQESDAAFNMRYPGYATWQQYRQQ